MNRWLVPAVGYVLVTGALGVTAKLALRTITWHELVIWTAIAYTVVAAGLILATGWHLHITSDNGLGLLTGFLAATGILLLSVALTSGEVSRVVPITSSYPLVALVLSVVFLSERVTPARVAGSILVVAGVALLTY